MGGFLGLQSSNDRDSTLPTGSISLDYNVTIGSLEFRWREMERGTAKTGPDGTSGFNGAPASGFG